MSVTIKEGWLKKSATILGGKKVMWKNKWVIVEKNDQRGTANMLYFDKQKDKTPKAVISLVRAAVGKPSQLACLGDDLVFTIHTPQREYTFLAENSHELAAWTSALENNIDEQLTGAPSQAAAQIAKSAYEDKLQRRADKEKAAVEKREAKAAEQQRKEQSKEEQRCRAAIDDASKLCAALVSLAMEFSSLEKRYESTTGLLQSTLANIEELQRTPPPSATSNEHFAIFDTRKATLVNQNKTIGDLGKQLQDLDKEMNKAKSGMSDCRSKLVKLTGNVFTGSFYSEVEPELAKARADIVVTQEAQDKAEAASTAARAVEKQTKQLERDVRTHDAKQEKEVRKTAKDEEDCAKRAAAVTSKAVQLNSDIATSHSKVAQLVVDIPALQARIAARGDEFRETTRELDAIAAETELADGQEEVAAALQLVEERKRRAAAVKRRAADISAAATQCQKQLGAQRDALAAAIKDCSRLEAAARSTASTVNDVASASANAAGSAPAHVRCVLPDLAPLQTQHLPQIEAALAALRTEIDEASRLLSSAEAVRDDVRAAEKGIRSKDKDLRGQAKDDEKSVKKLARRQTEARILREKEQDKAEKERLRDEAALAAARDDTQKLHVALKQAQTDLVLKQTQSAEIQSTCVNITQLFEEVDTLRVYEPSNVSIVAERCRARLQALDDVTRRVTTLNQTMNSFNKDCTKLRETLLTLKQKHSKLEALGRPQLKPELEQTNQLLTAATQWLARLDEKAAEQRADADKLRDQARAGISNEKDNEHALQRIADGESSAAQQVQTIRDKLAAADEQARALCRQVQNSNAALPDTQTKLTAHANELNQLSANFDALLNETLDETQPIEAQFAELDAAKARHQTHRKALNEAGTRLTQLDKDVARHGDALNQQQRELDQLRRDRLSEINALIVSLQSHVYSVEQWATAYVEHNVQVTPPDVDALKAQLDALRVYVRGDLNEALASCAQSVAQLSSARDAGRESERNVKQLDRNAKEQHKEVARELKRMAKAQSEAERRQIKEEERALRARERDAAALSNAQEELGKVGSAVRQSQSDVSALQKSVQQVDTTLSQAVDKISQLEVPVRDHGSVDLLLSDVALQLTGIDEAQSSAKNAIAELSIAEKELAATRDALARSQTRIERLEQLNRSEITAPLGETRQQLTAAFNDASRVEQACKAARQRQQQFKRAAAEAREAARAAERALRRVEQAEEDAERQKRQSDELLAGASGDARGLARRLESTKTELPDVEQMLTEIAQAQRTLAEHTARTDCEPDDSLPLDAQLAFVSEERSAALADIKRQAAALSARLASAERSLKRATATVTSLANERARLEGQSLPLLTSEVADLRERIDTTQQWASDFGGDDVRCDARLPEGRAQELEKQLVPQLVQYVAGVGNAVDAASAHAARLADDIAALRESERAQRQAESAAKEHAKAKQRELKRLLKALNAAEMQKIRDEERALRAQARLTDTANAALENATSLAQSAQAVMEAATQQDVSELQSLLQLFAHITQELGAVRRAQADSGQRPGISAQAATSDALWSAIDARRDTLNGIKRRSAALSEKLDTLAKRLVALRKETSKLQSNLAQQQKQSQSFRQHLQGAPAATLAIADATDQELLKALNLLSQSNVALEKRDSEVNLLRGTEAQNRETDKALREADAQSEAQLRGMAKTRAAEEKARRLESMRQAKATASGAGDTKMFGVSLRALERRAIAAHNGPGNPPMLNVIDAPLKWIEAHAMSVEGLFRLSGDANVIEGLRKQFDSGITPHFAPDANPHDVAGIFKLWFRRLPEPLIVYKLYPSFLQAGTGMELKALVDQLPGANKSVLKRVLRFLVKFLRYEASTRMGVKNLAVVFGPPMLRPPGNDPLQEMADMQAILDTMERMLYNVDTLFPSKSKQQHQQQQQQQQQRVPGSPQQHAPASTLYQERSSNSAAAYNATAAAAGRGHYSSSSLALNQHAAAPLANTAAAAPNTQAQMQRIPEAPGVQYEQLPANMDKVQYQQMLPQPKSANAYLQLPNQHASSTASGRNYVDLPPDPTAPVTPGVTSQYADLPDQPSLPGVKSQYTGLPGQPSLPGVTSQYVGLTTKPNSNNNNADVYDDQPPPPPPDPVLYAKLPNFDPNARQVDQSNNNEATQILKYKLATGTKYQT